MKLTFTVLVFVLSLTSLKAQEPPDWRQVYTFDESIIEMNSNVTFGGKDIGRLRFRWTFDIPQALSGERQVKYKSRLEELEFNCAERRYRPYEVTLLDLEGNTIRHEEMRPVVEWHAIKSGSMTEKLFSSACELITPRPPARNRVELDKVAKYAFEFSQRLELERDFKPILETFFAPDYLTGYLHDDEQNWFQNLNRDTAVKASRAELQRFYVALLNSGYLNSVFFISQSRDAARASIPEEKMIPGEVVELIDSHPYTASYKGNRENYDFLAERIDSVERLRSYTDLLEKIGTLMRKFVINVRAEQSKEYRAIWDEGDLFQPKAWICPKNCLGLPKGTKLFEVNVPLFRLQIADIKGQLKIVAAIDSQ
jgi:hypothetical protein